MALDTNSRFKILVVGDRAVGKTCALHSYTLGALPGEYLPTLECIGSYGATLDINSQRRSLEVLDAAPGVEVDRRRNLYSEVDLILILFSVTGPTSLESVKTIWHPETERHAPNTTCILVGTKADLRENAEMIQLLEAKGLAMVSQQIAERTADEIGAVRYLDISAQESQSLKHTLDDLFRALLS